MEAKSSYKRKRTNVIHSSSDDDDGPACDESPHMKLKRNPNPYIEDECSEGDSSTSAASSESDGDHSTSDTFESINSVSSEKLAKEKTLSLAIQKQITKIDTKIGDLFKKRQILVHRLSTFDSGL